MSVTFDGPNKLILVNSPTTSLDFRTDVYSEWKEWILLSDNAKYPVALSAIGGDPLPGGNILGSTFFLENGWRIRSWEGNHTLTITGNIFTREGDAPILPTLGDYNVTTIFTVSSLVEGGREVGAILGIDSVTQIDEIWKIHGLDATNPLTITATSRNVDYIQQTIADAAGTVTVTRTDT